MFELSLNFWIWIRKFGVFKFGFLNWSRWVRFGISGKIDIRFSGIDRVRIDETGEDCGGVLLGISYDWGI